MTNDKIKKIFEMHNIPTAEFCNRVFVKDILSNGDFTLVNVTGWNVKTIRNFLGY